ncbi:RNA-binding protein CP33, chloroplastic isoform X2 [Olea europaea var. sylvestris]|uniref:Gar2 n=1 Tax=Olea europaea subsp. europaea TaxID=158383 RepID=A0A8S0UQG7_OLEEU|nr:RNA-binding protein CP33, chloroplastic isoform X1 [Olea europaea var. sylvestris]XP_022871627.1 RNA-binding protein CP33, chloroplastic isoform X2 [Olea europaea var. sylvestris]CAA3022448.1 gar2 [Olea europaea subsp. europaea]
MVLSNKKLKQKLRAAKAELIAESEAQNHSSNENPENPNSNTQTGSLKNLFNSFTKKLNLSKRAKRREKTESDLQETAETVKCGENGGKEEGEEKKNETKKKRKRNESKEVKNVEVEVEKKVEQLKKKKKTKKKKKKAKKVENGGIQEQVVAEAVVGDESKQYLEVSNKVYVGGIPYYSTEDDIRSYFEGCGTITEVDCLHFPESGKFRGIAIISFKTEAAAKRALALDGSDMGGLYLKIQPYKSTRVTKVSNFSPSVVEGYNRIYVGNLSWDITEDNLRKLFSDCSITSIRFGEDKETSEFKGYAHVDFADSLSLDMALKMDQKIVCERPVRISCAVPKKGDATKSKFIPRNNQVDTSEASKVSANHVNSSGISAVDPTVSSKIRRRTCYECGERGHLSSSCPKKLAESTSPAPS